MWLSVKKQETSDKYPVYDEQNSAVMEVKLRGHIEQFLKALRIGTILLLHGAAVECTEKSH